MMKVDILERLRDNQHWLYRDGFRTSADNARDAADEIIKLRAELLADKADNARLRRLLEDWVNAYPEYTQAVDREALATNSPDDALREYGAKLVERLVRFSASAVELYDDATIVGDYMLDSSDCHEILIALIPYIADKIRKGEFK